MTYPYSSMHQSGVNTVPNLAQYGQYDPYQSVARQTQNQHQPPTLQPPGYTPNITVPMTQSYIQPPTQQPPGYQPIVNPPGPISQSYNPNASRSSISGSYGPNSSYVPYGQPQNPTIPNQPIQSSGIVNPPVITNPQVISNPTITNPTIPNQPIITPNPTIPNQPIISPNPQIQPPIISPHTPLTQSYIPTTKPIQSQQPIIPPSTQNPINPPSNLGSSGTKVQSRIQNFSSMITKKPQTQSAAPIPSTTTPVQHKTINTVARGPYDIFHIKRVEVPVWQMPGITRDIPPTIEPDFHTRWYYDMATTIGSDQYCSLFLWFKAVDTNGNGQLEPDELSTARFPGGIQINEAAAKKFIRIFGSHNRDYLTFFEFVGMFRFLEIAYSIYQSYNVPGDVYTSLKYRLFEMGFQWITDDAVIILYNSFYRNEGKSDMTMNQWVNLATFVITTTNNYFQMCDDGMFVNNRNAYDASLYLNKCSILIDGVNFA